MQNSRFHLSVCVLFVLLLLSCSVFSRETLDPVQESRGTQPPWKNEWTRGAVFYEIFVRSFYDSNGDGIGDLPGLISKLDYLNDGKPETTRDLGVDALWLMPVFKSPSYHGYDVTDYRDINPDYGTLAEFDRLLAEAHRRGIRVIIDLVLNHTSSEHPWFVDSASSPDSAKRDWYVWRPDNPGWNQPWGGNNQTWHQRNGAYYYGVFWGGMPDLNFRKPAVRKEMRQVAAFWLKRGVDGFRLDATRYLVETGGGEGQADTPETHAVLKRFSKRVRRVKPQAALVGENWTETDIIATYFGSTERVKLGDELPMNFNFPLADAILQAVRTGNAAVVAEKLKEVEAVYPAGIVDTPFLTNHDQVRLATQLQRREEAMRSAASILLTLPGAPFLYYGEEVGIQNGPAQGDEAKRTPMPWDNSRGGGFTTGDPWYAFAPGKENANVASQINNPASLLSHYRKLIGARKSSDALQRGDLRLLSRTSGQDAVLVFVRTSSSETVLVAHNVSNAFVSAGPYSVAANSFDLLYAYPAAPDPTITSGNVTINLPPHASAIWRIR